MIAAAASGPAVTASARAASVAARREAAAAAAEVRRDGRVASLAISMATDPLDALEASAAAAAVAADAAADDAVPPPLSFRATAAEKRREQTITSVEMASRERRVAFARRAETIAIAFPPSPPSEVRPECDGCAEFGACPAVRKHAHLGNPPGRFRSKLFEHVKAPRLQGCTWSSSCPDCASIPNGEVLALQRQYEATASHGWAPRGNRMFGGGDWMSQTTPMGHQGPVATHFCWCCWAKLHKTSMPGVECLPCLPPSASDPREPHHANPAMRVGASYDALHQQFVAAGANASAADFGSVINKPLIRAPGIMLDVHSITPLHLLLGCGMELVNFLEATCKKLDAEEAISLGLTAEDEKIARMLADLLVNLTNATAEVEEHQATVSHHINSLQTIVDSPNSADAVARAQKKRPRAKDYTPLPLEDEYRDHAAKLGAAAKALVKAEGKVDKLTAEHQELWGKQGGPRLREFNEMFEAFNLQRQAYFQATMNGWDIWRFFQQDAIDDFSQLVAPRLTCTPPIADPPDAPTAQEACGVWHGSQTLATSFQKLYTAFKDSASLFSRKEPLCDHELDRHDSLVSEVAHGYKEVAPPTKAPPPKLHMLCYHVGLQQRRLGSSGMLHEGVVEAFHVLDNRLTTRYACVKNLIQQLRCRAEASWQLASAPSIRSVEEAQELRKRERRNQESRTTLAEWYRKRKERLLT